MSFKELGLKTNQEIFKADLTDSKIIKGIAQKMQEDINGSKRPNPRLEEWLSQNIELLEPCLFNTYNGLRYKYEDKYDAILDMIEEKGLLNF